MATDNQPTALADLEEDLLDTPAAGPAAIRGSMLRVGGYVLGAILSVVSLPLLTRHLGFSAYGRYSTIIALVTIVQGVTDVGLGQIGVREHATRPVAERAQMMRNLLGLRFALTSVGVALATAFGALAGFAHVGGYDHVVVIGTLLAGIAMVLQVVQGTFSIPLQATLKLGWVTALDLLRQALSVVAIVVLVVAGARLLAFLAVLVPVAAVVLLATLALVRGGVSALPSFDRQEWGRLIRAVLPFAAAVVIGTIYLRVTLVLMSLLASGLETGYYAISFNVVSQLIAIPALTVGSALPVLARAARDDSERLGYALQRLFETTLIVGVGLALALALGSGFVIGVLAKGGSSTSVEVLEIQSFALLTQFVATPWQYGLLSLHRHRALLLISLGSLAVSVVLTLILVPLIKARGAAVAFSGAELTLAVSSFVLLKRAHPDLRFSGGTLVRVLAAAGLGTAILLVPGLTSVSRALIASVLYWTALVMLGAIPAELMQVLRWQRRGGR
jgi:O-antigen/teichoic acid export membrane protein